MPPSPASRCSPGPGREMRSESHRRGRSLEGALVFKEKDDDLALFNEMQTREREDFLVQCSDDFEDALTTELKYFSHHKIGVTIPARGESSDLLNTDGEKNDYEWLLTPPETPLFRSLDDEPAPVNPPLRGRQRSQPISISRSSTMDKSYRSSRSSASPSRLSLSPRSGNSIGHSRDKPSSAPHTSPISILRSPSPTTRRASSPSSKPSTPVPRSSSPTPQRISIGSNVSAGTSGVRGTSPKKVTRGNSSSPKVRAWQANIPGFSSDVPPNLRTSIADRPVSYVRGSLPASRNGRDSPSKTNRQSVSPVASRSISSSHSHYRDWFSSHSKGSIASPGDDAVDSPLSVAEGSLDQSTPRKLGGLSSSNRSLAFSRKPAKLSASAPKRSFDSVLRQMDNRKAPPNMFRPLLSSVPSTTFYVGKPSSTHLSSQYSATSSSRKSFDPETSALPDPEGHYDNHDVVVEVSGRTFSPDVEDEVFAFDKEDDAELREEIFDGVVNIQPGDLDECHMVETDPANSDDYSPNDGAMDHRCIRLCSLCGCSFDATDLAEADVELCPECMMKAECSNVIIPKIPEECQDLENGRPLTTDVDESKWSEAKSLSMSMVEIHKERLGNGQGSENPPEVQNPPSTLESENFVNHTNAKVTAAEVAGISLLLKRSSSSKGLVVQGRTFTASTFPYDDLSYARERANSMKSSHGHCSVSSLSSIDLSTSRHTETRVQRQLSGKKFEADNSRYEQVQSQSVGSSISGVTTSHSHQASEECVWNMDSDISKQAASLGQLQDNGADFTDLASLKDAVSKEDDSLGSEGGKKVDSSALEPSNHDTDVRFEDAAVASIENDEDLQQSTRHDTDVESLAITAESPRTENATLNPCHSVLDTKEESESGPASSSSVAVSEIEVDNSHQSISGSDVNSEVLQDLNSSTDQYQKPCQKGANPSDDGVVDILEETVTVENRRGAKSRSLTLEEATEAILFCNSIVHDIAINAATIAMEKEIHEPLEGGLRPAAIRRSSPDPHGGRIVSKRGGGGLKPNNNKARKRRMGSSEPKIENDENIIDDDESLTRHVRTLQKPDNVKPTPPPSLESKCNCTIM